jgi:hypothetical protein
VTTLDDVRARALRSLIPPPRLPLAQWIEANIVLPEGVSALPGRVQLWPYQRSFHCDYAAPPLHSCPPAAASSHIGLYGGKEPGTSVRGDSTKRRSDRKPQRRRNCDPTGTVRLDCCIVLAAGVPLARITSGADSSNCAAADHIQSALPNPH